MHDEVRTKEQICEPDQQLPDQPASPMSVKGEDYVDYTCQNDEPSNDHVDGTAARNGEPTAKIPKTISNTPQRIDNLEACRTISTGLCSAMETSSRRTD